jgi:hypothetical protein
MKKSMENTVITEYKKLKKCIRQKVNSVRKEEITRLLKNRNAKNIWKGVNSICGRSGDRAADFQLKHRDTKETVTNQQSCAELFGQSFINKVNDLLLKVSNKDVTAKFAKKKLVDVEDTAPIFVQADIVGVIKSMKRSNSSGPDDILAEDQVDQLRTEIEEINERLSRLRVSLAGPGPARPSLVLAHLINPLLPFELRQIDYSTNADLSVTVNLAGQSPTRPDFLTYLESLRADSLFADVESPVNNLIQDQNLSFTLKLAVTPLPREKQFVAP